VIDINLFAHAGIRMIHCGKTTRAARCQSGSNRDDRKGLTQASVNDMRLSDSTKHKTAKIPWVIIVSSSM
jgi:hypothetical protein